MKILRRSTRCSWQSMVLPGAWVVVGAVLLVMVIGINQQLRNQTLASAASLVAMPTTLDAQGMTSPADVQHLFLPFLGVADSIGSIAVSANPQVLIANGQNETTVTATVLNRGGQAMADIPVTFTTSAGLFTNNASVMQVATNPGGKATVTLRPGSAYTEIFTATVGAAAQNTDGLLMSSNTRVTFLPIAPARIRVTAAPGKMPANGVSSTTITARLEDVDGVPVANYSLELGTTLGSFGNGDSVLRGTTNADGEISTMLRSVLDIRTVQARVTAQASTATGNVTGFTDVRFEAPGRVLLIAVPNSISANVRSTTRIVATVQDASGSPVPSYPVDISATEGRFLNGQRAFRGTTDQTGVVGVDLFATPDLGKAVVTAQAGIANSQTSVDFVAGACEDFEPNDVPVQGKEQPSAVCSGTMQGEPQGEDDYYYVILSPKQKISVALTQIPAEADYDIVLYDSTLKIVAYSNDPGQRDEDFDYTAPGSSAEKYYIRVNMATKSSSAQNTYRLRVALNPLEDPEGTSLGGVADTPEGMGTTDPELPPKAAQP